MTILNPYINFANNAREAMEFYHSVFGGELVINTFGESQMSQDPSEDDKVMHAQLTTPGNLTLMASDTPNGMEHSTGSTMSVSLSGTDLAELGGYFEKFTEGGTVTLPFVQAPWGDTFGMVVDRFGVSWMVNATEN